MSVDRQCNLLGIILLITMADGADDGDCEAKQPVHMAGLDASASWQSQSSRLSPAPGVLGSRPWWSRTAVVETDGGALVDLDPHFLPASKWWRRQSGTRAFRPVTLPCYQRLISCISTMGAHLGQASMIVALLWWHKPRGTCRAHADDGNKQGDDVRRALR